MSRIFSSATNRAEPWRTYVGGCAAVCSVEAADRVLEVVLPRELEACVCAAGEVVVVVVVVVAELEADVNGVVEEEFVFVFVFVFAFDDARVRMLAADVFEVLDDEVLVDTLDVLDVAVVGVGAADVCVLLELAVAAKLYNICTMIVEKSEDAEGA